MSDDPTVYYILARQYEDAKMQFKAIHVYDNPDAAQAEREAIIAEAIPRDWFVILTTLDKSDEAVEKEIAALNSKRGFLVK